MYLRATARYTDGHGSGKMKMAVSDNMVIMASTNTAPVFPGTEDGTRDVAENTAADMPVGAPVTATDADAGDTLIYALIGADMASFDFNRATGQIMVGTGTVLDFETRTTYMVTVTVTDAAGDSDSIAVTITVTNEDEEGAVTLNMGQPVAGTAIMASLTDLDGGITGTTWQWGQFRYRRRDLRTHHGRHDGLLHPGGGRRWHVPASHGQLHRRRRLRQERGCGVGQHGGC